MREPIEQPHYAMRSLLHYVNHQARQRLREEIGRLVRHPLSSRRDSLDFADLRGIQKQRPRPVSLCDPVQRFMVIFRIQNGFLLRLPGAKGGYNQMLEK